LRVLEEPKLRVGFDCSAWASTVATNAVSVVPSAFRLSMTSSGRLLPLCRDENWTPSVESATTAKVTGPAPVIPPLTS
jgi:hypothetical protein